MSEKKFLDRIDPNSNNFVIINGVIESEFTFSHHTKGKNFYETRLIVQRYSGNIDYIPIVVEEALVKDNVQGKWIEANGEFRSHNYTDKSKHMHLQVYLYVTTFNMYSDDTKMENLPYSNNIYIKGFLCKPTIIRNTKTRGYVADLLIAVNRPCNRTDYIPCIVWGKNAKYCSELKVGDQVEFFGRIQSRDYYKKISEEVVEKRTTYEVSISAIKLIRTNI